MFHVVNLNISSGIRRVATLDVSCHFCPKNDTPSKTLGCYLHSMLLKKERVFVINDFFSTPL